MEVKSEDISLDVGGSRIISLDVGGTIFRTTSDTLLSHKPKDSESFFSVLLSSSPTCSNFFIDRDPECFRVVLNYLRDGIVWSSSSGHCTTRLKFEFAYFNLNFPDILPNISKELEQWMHGTLGECRMICVNQQKFTIHCGTKAIFENRAWCVPFTGLRNTTEIIIPQMWYMKFLNVMGFFNWKIKHVEDDHQASICTFILQFAI